MVEKCFNFRTVCLGITMTLLVVLGLFINDSVTVLSESAPLTNRRTLIIDPGHGGVDGGATSFSGVLESRINLEISLRLDDLCHLLGIQTRILRTEDISLHTQEGTIAQKKISDLKERVRIIESTQDPLVVSIHQNYFQESQYSGAQVFYPDTPGSKELAGILQKNLIQSLNPGSNRSCKPAQGVYLMKNISCTAVLVECGFLSNPAEDRKLQDPTYQKQLCSIIATKCSEYMFGFDA